jgi:tRNA pseudouridine55 synthase
MIYNLYKKRGETPLECLKRFAKILAKEDSEIIGQKMTYMGRLDPLAEGVLLTASGADVKRKEEFLDLDKEYEFVALFGFATDTYDILGKVVRESNLSELEENEIRKIITVHEGEKEQKYPEYSSKMLASKNKEEVQTKKINIYKIKFHGLDTLNKKELFGRLLMDITRVNGDFRQVEILNIWKQILLETNKDDHCRYFLGRFSAEVSSGTYIRSLVNDLGQTLGCAATTLSIKRTRVGDYDIKDSIKS